ncbi:hypothetical protein M2158_006727 [Streptomyces sp. SAI-144]|uniref:hypothetical protein n=1 Tax=Streptomyces sp. SAI-144 TaxID=2940544 RepID=UPI002472FCE0|nr:hypothetical protein [Streptomyces sp. SAI-144]MDH6438186.1 hypothetical protein [Streptomyces sp. SAI-144]
MSRYRRAAGTALLVAAAFAVGGCASDSEPTTARTSAVPEGLTDLESESTAPADDSDTDPAPAETGDDTSLEDFLAAAGVGDALVNQLGEIGDANNYGLGEGVETSLEDRRGLATVQVTTCRNVAVAYRTWEGIRHSDEASGATEDQAAAMADFLRTEFCPHVAPLKEAPLPEQTLGGPSEDDLGGRGLASPVTWWDGRYPRASWSKACAAQTGMPIGDPVAYRLAKDEVVCATVPSATSLKEHLISVDIVFSSPVDEDRARKAALALLPSDASATKPTEGTNPDWSYLGGGCLNINFPTATMKRLMDGLEKDAEPWASALYYSDGATEDGAVGDYTGEVKQISLSTGANEPGTSGELTC